MPRPRALARRRYRKLTLRAGRQLGRRGVRNLPGHRREPSDFAAALTAFARALRCHGRLARIAPACFDSAVVEREARERLERRRWMQSWEPYLEKAYGPAATAEPRSGVAPESVPVLGPRTQRAVNRELAGWNFWLAAGDRAMDRHQRRRPHALPSFTQLARLIEIGTSFGRLACGLDSGSPVPPASPVAPDCDAALARIYGHARSINSLATVES